MSPDEAKYPEFLRSLSLDELGFPSLNCGNGIVEHKDPVTVLHVADPQALLVPDGLRGYLLGLGIRTLLVIPLTSRGEANGVFSFLFSYEPGFSAEELEMGLAVAPHSRHAIQLTPF